MSTYVALLRAVNVGGTGILPMAELRALCEAQGLEQVRTYIQSGNVLFESGRPADDLKAALEGALSARLGTPAAVLLREAGELARILAANPFPEAAGNRVAVIFLDRPLPAGALDRLTIPGREEVRTAGREVFVHYPDGMGRSKLKLPFAAAGTARNLNTLARLVALADG